MTIPQPSWLRPLCILLITTILCITAGLAEQAAAKDKPSLEPVTTTRIDIPIDELELLVKPLKKDELISEADAWLKLLRAKVEEVSAAEIAVKQKNRQIEKTKEAKKEIDKAKESLEQVKEATQKTLTDTTGKASAEAVAAAEKAQQAAESVAAKVEEVKATAQNASQNETVKKAVKQSTAEVTQKLGGTEKFDKIESQMEQRANTDAEIKTKILDSVANLRAERTALIDRLGVVLNELNAKLGKTLDGKDNELVVPYRLYMDSVGGIKVDVSDKEAAWATILGWVQSDEGGIRWAKNIAKFIATVFAFWILGMVLGKLAQKAFTVARNSSILLRDFVVHSVRRVTLFIGLIFGLAALEINIGPLLALIGAAGFVVAFALQNTLSNFASGIMIMLYKPFDVGNFVDVAGVAGVVRSMNLVTTTITTPDNQIMVVPNNSIWGNIIINITGSAERRVDLVFGIGYGDDIGHAEKVLADIVSEHPLVLATPAPVIQVHELADSSVNFICRPWAKTNDYWTVYWDLTRMVKERFDAEGISIPFPQRDVHIFQEQQKALA